MHNAHELKTGKAFQPHSYSVTEGQGDWSTLQMDLRCLEAPCIAESHDLVAAEGRDPPPSSLMLNLAGGHPSQHQSG